VAGRRLGSAPEWAEVPRAVALERLERLLEVQRAITAEGMQAERGREVEILVEGTGEDGERRYGRTPENRLVHLAATEAEAPTGALVRVKVVRVGRASLGGDLLGRAGQP
jgi:tRNA-2-methylthio-N6-dimethylallyladenosine synthase